MGGVDFGRPHWENSIASRHRLIFALMDPRDLLDLARKLALGATAADRRTAVGRSYYAVFNVAAEHLRTLGFRISRGAAAHGEVQKCLSNSGDSALANV